VFNQEIVKEDGSKLFNELSITGTRDSAKVEKAGEFDKLFELYVLVLSFLRKNLSYLLVKI
jgi:hypothetical protein